MHVHRTKDGAMMIFGPLRNSLVHNRCNRYGEVWQKRQFYHADSSTRFRTTGMARVCGMPNQPREKFGSTEKFEGVKWPS